jgi:hypothetical protein
MVDEWHETTLKLRKWRAEIERSGSDFWRIEVAGRKLPIHAHYIQEVNLSGTIYFVCSQYSSHIAASRVLDLVKDREAEEAHRQLGRAEREAFLEQWARQGSAPPFPGLERPVGYYETHDPEAWAT